MQNVKCKIIGALRADCINAECKMQNAKFRGTSCRLYKSKSNAKPIIPFLPLAKKGGGKKHDRALWAMQGVCVGAVVKEIEQANSATISLGTTRGLNISLSEKQIFKPEINFCVLVVGSSLTLAFQSDKTTPDAFN